MIPPAAETNKKPITWRGPFLTEWAIGIRAELVRVAVFCRRPTRRHFIYVSISSIIPRMMAMLLAYWVFTAVIVVPLLLGLDKLLDLKWQVDLSTTRALIMAVAVAPLFEELVFRAGLRNPTMTLAVQPILITLYLTQWKVASALCGVVAIILLVDHIRQRFLKDEERFSLRMVRRRAFLTHYRWIVWGYAVAFGLCHMSNSTSTHANGWLALMKIMVVFPQIIMGVVLSYWRLRYGLLSAIVFHAMINLSVVVF